MRFWSPVSSSLYIRSALLAAAMATAFAVPEVRAQASHAGHALGKVTFEVSCSKEARAEFITAVSLLHHMTYPQAREAFERTARVDPRCAMAHWGVAMTLFQPLWPTRPTPADLRRGWDEARKALELKPPTARERLFVESAAAFFRDPGARDYWERIRAWERAMETVYAASPEDPEAAAFYALALLATAPASGSSLAQPERAEALLLPIYERNPEHPGAMHYIVHASDFPGRETASLEIVRKYESVAPRNPHALHMPTHIYTRLGDWEAVVRGNLRAAEAALEHPAGAHGDLVWDEFPHAIEYLVYAHLQLGADDAAEAQLRRLHGTPRLEPTFKTAFHLASTSARYALERRAWKEAAALPVREPASLDWDHYPWAEGVTWFARGLGSAHTGNAGEAQAARERLGTLERAARAAGEELFARNLGVMRLGVEAWIAHAAKDMDKSLALMREAAELEESTPKHAVTPGPTLPARELLGDMLLEQGRTEEARAAYARALALYPRRFNSIVGAARAATRAGDEVAARAFYRKLVPPPMVEGAPQPGTSH